MAALYTVTYSTLCLFLSYHCLPCSCLQFLGNDVLHIYNKEQIKHRFNIGGLYIANTKVHCAVLIDMYSVCLHV